MAITVEMKSLTTNPDGSVAVTFTDGSGYLFGSMADLLTFNDYLDQNPEIAKTMLLRWWLARQPDGSNTNLVVGKRLTFDLSAANMIRVQ